jgi:hypothetical protein
MASIGRDHFMAKLPIGALLVFAVMLWSCKPRIYSFRATPATSSGKDSIRLDWDVRGKPSVLFSRRSIAQPPNDSVQVLEFKLIVTKGKTDSFRTIQVPVFTDLARDRVVFPVDTLIRDTAVARGIKDTVRWKGYGISQVRGMAGRQLVITHQGVVDLLTDTIPSAAWSGKPYPGYWEIKAGLTDPEKKNHSIIPERLTLTITVHSPK